MVARRTILKSALGAAALAALPRALAAASAKIDVARVTDSIALVTGAGGNVLSLSTPEGLVVIDSGTAAAAADLKAALGALPNGGKVRTLFNTHWHHEQTGGNEALGHGATIVAHEKTRLRLAVGYYVPAEDRYEKPVPAAAQPTESFYTTGETKIANQRIEYGYLLEAHTDGDCYVYFRDANVIAVGDAVSPARDPELDWFGGGWLGGRVDALDLLLKLGNAQHEVRAKLRRSREPRRRAEGARHVVEAVRAVRRTRTQGRQRRRHSRGGHHERHRAHMGRPQEVRTRCIQRFLGASQHVDARHRLGAEHAAQATLATRPGRPARRWHRRRGRLEAGRPDPER